MLPNYLDPLYILKRTLREITLVYKEVIPTRKYRELRKSWAGHMKMATDRDAVLIAGGPSFTKEMSEIVVRHRSRVDVVAVNFYCKSVTSDSIIPDYYVLSDPGNLRASEPSMRVNNQILTEYLQKHSVRVVCPLANDWVDKYDPFLCFDDEELFLYGNISPLRPRGYPSNTFFKAIAIALALGYGRIFLLGLDYDYPRKLWLDKKNQLYLRDEHHYGQQDTSCEPYFKNVAHALSWWSVDFHLFSRVKAGNIYNVTDSSLVDFYTRISPSDFEKILIKS